MLKVAVVENDEAQARRLENYILQYAKEGGEPCNVVLFRDGIDFVSDYTGDFDAVFMDIDMPLMDGLSAAERLRKMDETVSIVFVTNLAQYAIEGYKVHALDYLVKPVDAFELSLELKKIARLKQRSMGDFVWLTVLGAMRRVPLMDIVYVEMLRHDVSVHTKTEVYTYRGTLKEAEERLGEKHFSRCHNCYIVNLHYVTDVNGDEITLETGMKIFMSRNRKKKFMLDLTAYVAANGGAVKGAAKKS